MPISMDYSAQIGGLLNFNSTEALPLRSQKSLPHLCQGRRGSALLSRNRQACHASQQGILLGSGDKPIKSNKGEMMKSAESDPLLKPYFA